MGMEPLHLHVPAFSPGLLEQDGRWMGQQALCGWLERIGCCSAAGPGGPPACTLGRKNPQSQAEDTGPGPACWARWGGCLGTLLCTPEMCTCVCPSHRQLPGSCGGQCCYCRGWGALGAPCGRGAYLLGEGEMGGSKVGGQRCLSSSMHLGQACDVKPRAPDQFPLAMGPWEPQSGPPSHARLGPEALGSIWS